MQGGKVFIWMNLLGFERNDADKGARRFLEQTGFVPDGACALMCHPDFFHQHKGMEQEYELSPDNCAYWGIPYNVERARQPWTNYDLRELADNLEQQGSHLYADIFGIELNNAFHEEWINEHPEIRRHGAGGAENARGHFALKRFRDGTYYEDFFIEKVCQVLQDYGMKGIHLSDSFCPPNGGMLHSLDYSTDYVDQFLMHSGAVLPEEVAATMGCDDQSSEEKRRDYIYTYLREEWVAFNVWRWTVFFEKLCARVHAIGKEVLVLGMYCTDPFETKYCIGIDLKRIVEAGVDYITANILPTSVYMGGADDRPNYFHRYMAIAPTTAAHLPKGHLVSMVGLQDAAEEWSAMHHLPCQHERDLYTMMAYQMVDGEGTSRALDGYFLCLGDGIPRNDWDWERERMEIAMSARAERVISPAMLWSDHAYENMLHAYIYTRRWTPFKLFYELAKAGTHCAACVRPEGLAHYSGTLVVPDFDMLSEEEKRAVAAYDRGAVVCSACPGFDPEMYGIKPVMQFSDRFSNYPLTCFVFGCEVSEELCKRIAELLAEDDGTSNLEGNPRDVKEHEYTLQDTLVFAKVTKGFLDAMALLLKAVENSPLLIDKPHMILQMSDSTYRLYLFNDSDVKYHRAFVKCRNGVMKDARIISKFPILPPRFMDEATGQLHHAYTGKEVAKTGFEVKLQPGGVTIVDVIL